MRLIKVIVVSAILIMILPQYLHLYEFQENNLLEEPPPLILASSSVNNYSSMEPIFIFSDQELLQFKNQNNLSGNGNNSNPFIIENFKIDANGIGAGIFIANTRSHLLVRNCEVFNSTREDDLFLVGAGVRLHNTMNLTINNLTLHSNVFGVLTGPPKFDHIREIKLSSPTEIENYQVEITIQQTEYNYSQVNSNGSDIRFYDEKCNNLNYCIDTWNLSGTSRIWVNATSNGTSHIWMTYGNESSPPRSDPELVFDFYEDFSDSGYSDKWVKGQGLGTVVVADGKAYLNATSGLNGWSRLISKSAVKSPFFAECRMKRVDGDGTIFALINTTNSYNNTLNYINGGNYGIDYHMVSYGPDFGNYSKVLDSSTIGWDVLSTNLYNTSWHVFRGDAFGNWDRNDTLTIDKSADQRLYNIQLLSHQESSSTSEWDWVRVRKYSEKEIITTIGCESIAHHSNTILINRTSIFNNSIGFQSYYCQGITFQDNIVENNTVGVFLDSVSDHELSGNILKNNTDGIHLIDVNYHSFNIELSASTPSGNYPLNIKLDSSFTYDLAKNDGSDLRIVDQNGFEIDHWIEYWNINGNSSIWFEAKDKTCMKYSILYGDVNRPSESDGDEVFTFFDDFEGPTVDSNKWITNRNFGDEATHSISEGKLRLSAPSDEYDSIYETASYNSVPYNFTGNYSFHFSINTTDIRTGHHCDIYLTEGSNILSIPHYFTMYIGSFDGSNHTSHAWYEDSWTEQHYEYANLSQSSCDIMLIKDDKIYSCYYRNRSYDDWTLFSTINGSLKGEANFFTLAAGGYIPYNIGYDYYYDNVYIRKYGINEPNISFSEVNDTRVKIYNNNIMNNENGISIDDSRGLLISNNWIIDNDNATVVKGAVGIIIKMNIFKENYNGILLNRSDSCMVIDNCFFNNSKEAIKINDSTDNSIYNNAFVLNNYTTEEWSVNINQCYDSSSSNHWYNNDSNLGNYWYDNLKNDDNGDGVVDVQYNISGSSNSDPYPLVSSPLYNGSIDLNITIEGDFFNLSWTPVLNIWGIVPSYLIYYRVGDSSTQIISQDSNSPRQYDFEITDFNTDYHFYIRASSILGYSAPSQAHNSSLKYFTDLTQENSYVGSELLFNVSINPEKEVNSVQVEYWNNPENSSSSSMSTIDGENFTYIFKIPGNWTTLYYRFIINFTQGFTVETLNNSIILMDRIKPFFANDTTPTSGSTGDPFHFSLYLYDNWNVNNVTVEYWFGNGTHHNISMENNGVYERSIEIPEDSLDIMHYIYHANDTSGNWNDTDEKAVLIIDNDLPVVGVDNTRGNCSTGESISFEVNITDNIGIQSVHVEYWFNWGGNQNETMSFVSNFSLDMIVPDNASWIKYRFHFTDSSNNWNSTVVRNISVEDDEFPTFGLDSTPSIGTTGGQLTFQVSVNDNIAVTNVTVEYWFGSDPHLNLTMDGEGAYDLTINISGDETDDLFYIFHASDSSGNWIQSSQKQIDIQDDDAPVFGIDGTPMEGTTGDPFLFSINVSDNIGVSNVFVYYRYGSGSYQNRTLNLTTYYSLIVTIPNDSNHTLYYSFHATDGQGNWRSTPERSISIIDNKLPIFGTDSTPMLATTGDPFRFNVSVTDNIEIASVWVEYWFGNQSSSNESLNGNGPYYLTLQIPTNSTLTLYYIFHATDTSDNYQSTLERPISVVDNDLPSFGIDDSPQLVNNNEILLFSIYITDNIEVANVTVEYWFGNSTHANSTMILNSTGAYTFSIQVPINLSEEIRYIIHACDTNGNWNETIERSINVEDSVKPQFDPDDNQRYARTGESIWINITVTDNVGISQVHIEYRYGNGSSINATMEGSGLYSISINIPLNSNASLYYKVSAVDTSGNWNSMDEVEIRINDTIDPEINFVLKPGSVDTGSLVTISVNVTDNIEIAEVWVVYRFGSGPDNNQTLNGLGQYNFTIQFNRQSNMTLHYVFHAIDTSGNYIRTIENQVTVTDRELPQFFNNSTPNSVNNGEQLKFSIDVSDNIEVVNVTVEYWFGNSAHTNLTMIGIGPYWRLINISDYVPGDLNYIFHACDSSGNWNLTSVGFVVVRDGIRPSFSNYSLLQYGKTGADLNITISVSDNYEVSGVWIEYRFGNGNLQNLTMDLNGSYYKTIIVSPNSTDSLFFIVKAKDNSGNWNETERCEVKINDTTSPAFIFINKPVSGTTGDELTITINATDNIKVQEVRIDYWKGNDSPLNETKTYSGLFCSFIIDVDPNSIEKYHYYITIFDSWSNENKSGTIHVSISDNDPPELESDDTDISGNTGEQFDFIVSFDDNIAMDNVVVYYSTDNISFTSSLMTFTSSYGHSWITNESARFIYYYFIAFDNSSNSRTTEKKMVKVIDVNVPVIRKDETKSEGYTGKKFTFKVSIYDNWDEILDVKVVIEGDFFEGSFLMEKWGEFYYYNRTLSRYSIDPFSYYFTFNDTSGNLDQNLKTDVTILDNIIPENDEDRSPMDATTGDQFQFKVKATDNIGIKKVYLHYWFGNERYQNNSMAWDGELYFFTHNELNHTLKKLRYRFYIIDTSDNLRKGDINERNMIDNDHPLFEDELTPNICNTGQSLEFRVKFNDNIGMNFVFVEYWFGSEGEKSVNKTMLDNWPYNYTIIVPSDMKSKLFYIFRANDSSGNWISTSIGNVTVLDSIDPIIGEDESDRIANTGKQFSFSIHITDNIGLDEVRVRYRIGSDNYQYGYLQTEENDRYTYELIIPEDAIGTIQYNFIASDSEGNEASTEIKSVEIRDIIDPIIDDTTDMTPTTGEPFYINATIIDNIGIDNVHVEYRFGSGESTNKTMSERSGDYSVKIIIPNDFGGDLHYFIHCGDASGNLGVFDWVSINIIDNDDPVLKDLNPDILGRGQTYILTFNITDNVGISSAILFIWYSSDSDPVSHTLENPYNLSILIPFGSLDDLNYYLIIQDMDGNTIRSENKTIVLTDRMEGDDFPDDPSASIDSDGDGYPDEWNPTLDESDSTSGLYLDAFPNDKAASMDTDGDGYPDSWNEGMNEKDTTTGLELDVFPNDPYEWKDSDGDGIGDNSDRFPNIHKTLLLIITASLVALVLLAIMSAILVRNKYHGNVKKEISKLEGQIRELESLGMNAREERQMLKELKERKKGGS